MKFEGTLYLLIKWLMILLCIILGLVIPDNTNEEYPVIEFLPTYTAVATSTRRPTPTYTIVPSRTPSPTITRRPTPSKVPLLIPTVIISEYLTIKDSCPVSIYKEPNTSSLFVGVIRRGNIVKVIKLVKDENGDTWYKIHGGYLFSPYVKDYYIKADSNLVSVSSEMGVNDE